MRIESDALGTKKIPYSALYGIQTLRASENFSISGKTVDFIFIQKIALLKKVAALAHLKLNELPKHKAKAIIQAANEIIEGQHQENFITDPFQGGATTSIHMNVNEVIANRALEILGKPKGQYESLHPNDDVNKSQSTNDVTPSALKIALIELIDLLNVRIDKTIKGFEGKAMEAGETVKLGRTHLQDAVPIKLASELLAFAFLLKEDKKNLKKLQDNLLEIHLGGTAVGAGDSASINYQKLILSILNEETGLNFCFIDDNNNKTKDPEKSIISRFAKTSTSTDFCLVSNVFKNHAIGLIKISNDLRLLSSGPLGSLQEIQLPELQPGSSIMPGKVNPVVPEVVAQVGFQIIGADQIITLAAQAAQLQLSVMLPIISFHLLQSLRLLEKTHAVFYDKCIKNINFHKDQIKNNLDRSTAMSTKVAQFVGYEKASELAKIAVKNKKSFSQTVKDSKALSNEQYSEIFKTST